MAAQNLTQITNRLRAMMRDAGDSTFLTADKTEALTQAINDDPWVAVIDRDDSQTYTSGMNSFDLANNFQELIELRLDVLDDGFGWTIDPGGYEVVNGTVYFRNNHNAMPTGHKLIQFGKRKLYTTDSIPDYLVPYILHNAAASLTEMLMHDKTGRFLKNDTTMAELQATVNEHRLQAERFRMTLINKNPTVL